MDDINKIMAIRVHATAGELRVIAFESFIKHVGDRLLDANRMKIVVDDWIKANPIESFIVAAEILLRSAYSEAQ